ncbi:MAG: elongation factor P maturation arginine rhamnosyltransferase EarP [Betaproteobacteria bacterium]|nr:elongation factor P maturation arginine rhamnosyltransferase EarP [Betaproteobacteria bacterium]
MRAVPWDIFCTVIDNFGDIGVTWRLSRQLAAEHGVAVRLWVDDLEAFRRLCPEVDPELDIQHLLPSPGGRGSPGVEVRRWTAPLPEVEPGALVIEALACTLPDAFIERMAQHDPKPVWLNLEYLSAEDWVEGVHGLPSPHPRLPLLKHFFMPGFTTRTGGLTRERGLSAARDAFQTDADAQAVFWADLGLPPAQADELRLTLFSYENRALPGLLTAWAEGDRAIRACVPEGKALPQIAAWFGVAAPPAGATLHRGRLTLHVLPMLDLDAYDRLLWACDLNFVRGEDSFLRAQYAARPMVWQAYPQEEAAHLIKLDAFLRRYCADQADDLARLTQDFWRAWNREAAADTHWTRWLAALPRLGSHARAWDSALAKHTDLASKLLIFFNKQVGSQPFSAIPFSQEPPQ